MGEHIDMKEMILFLSQIIIFSLIIPSFFSFASSDPVGVPPEVINITIDDFKGNVTLIANSTKTVTCTALVVDYDGEDGLSNVTAFFYDISNATNESSDDNNNHYTNNSCYINKDFGSWKSYTDDEYSALSTCTFQIEYYANPGNWNCSLLVTDNESQTHQKDDTIEILELLAISLPDSIDYGIVNILAVSSEQIIEIENLGNVPIDIALSAYASTPGDNLAMNCTSGLNKTIGLENERYNLTSSTPEAINLSKFQNNYKNVSNSSIIENINLNYRHNDSLSEAISPTYWRIYVPIGIAGTCAGNIIFDTIKSD